MATMTVECPFCHTSNNPDATAGYCEKCGRKLPQSADYTTTTRKPRRMRDDLAEETGGIPTRYPTSGALLTGTVLCLVLGGVSLILGPMVLRWAADEKFVLPRDYILYVMGCTVAVTAVMGLLAFLARFAPIPAAYLSVLAQVGGWAALLNFYPPAWPLAVPAVIVLGWLVWAVVISHRDEG